MRRVTLDLSRVQDPAVKAALAEIARASAINDAATLGSGTIPDGRFKATSYVHVNRNGVDQGGVANGVWTKVQLANKVLDPQGAFDAVTNYRYSPQVAGKYLCTGTVFINSSFTADGVMIVGLYKNGSLLAAGPVVFAPVTGNNASAGAVGMLDLNGAADYVELYVIATPGATYTIAGATTLTYFFAQRIGP